MVTCLKMKHSVTVNRAAAHGAMSEVSKVTTLSGKRSGDHSELEGPESVSEAVNYF